MTHPSQVLRANVCNSTEVPPSSKTEEKRWASPPNLMAKINFDAALDVSERVVGLGILARDERGRVKGACSVTMKVSVSPLEAKALVALHAVSFAEEREYSGVIF
jgi:hypothetical protein